jgi:transcriptional antiterminator
MVYDMKKSQMARVVEFDKLVNSKGYPNVHRFSVDYEVSGRTIARDIEYLRDTLGAPLEYDLARNGYYYSEPWNLPAVITLSTIKEDQISILIEQIKGLNLSEREFVINSVGFGNPIVQPETLEPRHLAVA